MRITAIVNSKGGTNKTATAVNLATSAALSGKRVLLVDMDKQGSATKWLSYSPENEGLVEALLGVATGDSITVATSVDGLSLIPASVGVQQERVTSEFGSQFLLREVLSKVTPYDWVIVDSPGDLGPSTIMALTAATDVVIPVPAGAMELDEVPLIKDTIAKVQTRLNPGLTVAGVLLTQVRTYGRHTSVLAREVLEQLQVDFPAGEMLETVIRDDMRFREAYGAREPMAVYDPDGKGDQDYRAALAELMDREVVDAR